MRDFDPLVRPGWDEWGLEIANAVAIRGDCRRRRVGAVITTPDHKIIGTGFNGVAPGEVGCVESPCPRVFSAVAPDSDYGPGKGECYATHAEVNAVVDASSSILPGSTIYTSEKPCPDCWKVINRFQMRCVWPSGVREAIVTEVLDVPVFRGPCRVNTTQRLVPGSDLIILLHGLGCTKNTFMPVFRSDALSRYSLCSFDFPGHGKSLLVPHCSNMNPYAQVALGIMEITASRCNPSRVWLIGHSMGGAVASVMLSLVRASLRDITGVISLDGNLVDEDCGIISRSISQQPRDTFNSSGYSSLITRLSSSLDVRDKEWAKMMSQADSGSVWDSAFDLVQSSHSGYLLRHFNESPRRSYIYGDSEDRSYIIPKLRDGTIIKTVPDAHHFMLADNPHGTCNAIAAALDEMRCMV